MEQPIALSPDLYFRHSACNIRFEQTELNRLTTSIQSRSISIKGMSIEFIPPLDSMSNFPEGRSLVLNIRLPHHSEFFRAEGAVVKTLRLGEDPSGMQISLVALKFTSISVEGERALKAHETLLKSKFPENRSPRIPVRFRVEPAGIDVMTSLTAIDLSMTGMFVAGKAKFPVGKSLRLSCKLPFQRDEVLLPGKVIWTGQKNLADGGPIEGFGFQFLNVEPREHAKLATYYSRYDAGA